MNAKKFQFYFAVIALGATAFLFVLSFIITFGNFTGLLHMCDINTDAVAVFTVLFGVVGRMLTPIVRECFDDAFGKQ